jgi:3-deoxy-manno-octulosonate cytidylyltransferase (CMP-KDO synthetase)
MSFASPFIVVIPARFGSSRLPGKPLADIGGQPMIQHVWQRAQESRAGRVVIATDDGRVQQACERFGAEVVMTSAAHVSGTDRLAEVAKALNLGEDHRVINVQGDEPLIPSVLINQVADNLDLHPEAAIATLCERLHDTESVFNPNVVKVVFDQQGMAHYFSRAPIPWYRDGWAGAAADDAVNRDLPDSFGYFRHIGIYGYRAGVLADFVRWPPAPAEQVEALEQLRALYNGARIHVDLAAVSPPAGVDTEADLQRVRAFLNKQETN